MLKKPSNQLCCEKCGSTNIIEIMGVSKSENEDGSFTVEQYSEPFCVKCGNYRRLIRPEEYTRSKNAKVIKSRIEKPVDDSEK